MFCCRASVTSRPRRPDRAVYVPRARRSQTTPPASTAGQQNASHDLHHVSTNSSEPTTSNDDSPTATKDTSSPTSQIRTRSSAPSSPAAKQSQAIAITPSNHSQPNTNGVNHCDTLNRNGSSSFEEPLLTTELIEMQQSPTENMDNHTGIGLRIEDAQYDPKRHNAKEDNKDEKELQRASKVSADMIQAKNFVHLV